MTARPRKATTQAAVTKPDFLALLGTARMPERTVQICLRGDLAAELEALDAELEHAQKTPRTSLAGTGTTALVEQIEALQDQMRAHTYPVRLRALTRHAWRELALAHPPREDDKGEVLADDRLSGVNRDTFFEPMLRASIVDPVLDDAQFAQLAETLTDRQYEGLVQTCWDLNQGEIDIPFSRAAWRARRTTSDE